jgi:hypothetical protein
MSAREYESIEPRIAGPGPQYQAEAWTEAAAGTEEASKPDS